MEELFFLILILISENIAPVGSQPTATGLPKRIQWEENWFPLTCPAHRTQQTQVPEERGYIKRILYHDFRIILFYNIWIDNVSFYLFLQEENVKSSGRESLRGNLGISTTIYFKMTN